MAPSAASSNAVTASVGSTLGDHAAIVPASVAQINTALLLTPFELITKFVVGLKMMPVGMAGPLVPAGIETTSDCALPSPSNSEAFSVLLSETHMVAVGLKVTPQAFSKSASALVPATL